jgi:DNA topoisomerase I
MVIKDGRFGPYVTDGETNASLRKGDEVTSITVERGAELLADRRAAPPTTRRRTTTARTSTSRTAKTAKTATAKPAAKTGTAKSATAKTAASRKKAGSTARPAAQGS